MRGRICGTGSYLPPRVMDNNDIAQIVKTNDEWIRERTGIARRHITEDDNTVTMSIKAGRAALENAGWDALDLDMILVATLTPNSIVPCVACLVQKELGAYNALCFDMSAACCGFLFAYNTVQAYMQLGTVKRALIIGAETLSAINNWEDRGSCILFGDGAGAAVIEAEEGEPYPMVAHSDGRKGHVLACESRTQKGWEEKEALRKTYVDMDGQEVFKFAVKTVPQVVKELLDKIQMNVDEVDMFVLHQANKRIIESIIKRLKADGEKFPMNIQECGNTSSASVGILLDELNRSGQLKSGQKLVLAGFGAGLSWGATYMEWK